MAVCNETYNFFNEVTNVLDLSSIDLIEFGDQDYIPNGWNAPHVKFRQAMMNKFKSWRSLDLHQREGVEIYDLSIDTTEVDSCDVLTDFGTIEHVEFEHGQYTAWNNAHRMLRTNGIAIHVLPQPNTWPNHCRYYYPESFYRNLESYGYRVLSLKSLSNHLIACAVLKVENKNFMSFDEFFSHIMFLKENMHSISGENNPKGLISAIKSI